MKHLENFEKFRLPWKKEKQEPVQKQTTAEKKEDFLNSLDVTPKTQDDKMATQLFDSILSDVKPGVTNIEYDIELGKPKKIIIL